jgi:hypothetical protein
LRTVLKYKISRLYDLKGPIIMKNNILPEVYCFIFLVFIPLQNINANNDLVIPDISGIWENLDENGDATEAKFTFSQDGKYLDGTFTDSKNGEIIVEAPSTGFIDINGNVIFDIYFGRITSTNRLKLSSDKNNLDGTYINNAGHKGEVHIRRQ